MLRLLIPLLISLSLAYGPARASGNYHQRGEVDAFIDAMVEQHGFDRTELRQLFGKVDYKQSIIDAITRPAESKPWHQYRPIFVTESRIRQGIAFWNENADTLARAEKEYGIPAEIIVAIVGVETRYGRHQGTYRVIDALATLGFDYPPRANFFRGQLEQFLLMAREEGVDPLSLDGSYAGAMGQPQFIASSFRSYAVDFDEDGRKDLWNNPDDVIGSVANYFHRHRWREGDPIAARAEVKGNDHAAMLEKGYKPSTPIAKLGEMGISTGKRPFAPEMEAALISLEGSRGAEYWIALHNFYVITRYNHSPLYAMAIYQLSEAIRSGRAEELAARAKGSRG